MPYHDWNDDWFKENGADLNDAIYYCMDLWKKWGRIGSHGKEKFGSFRDNPVFWTGGLYNLMYPGYVWVKYPFLYFKLDWYVIKPFTKWTGLHRLGLWYQYQVYNYGVQQTCKKYPNVIDEIVCGLERRDLIKPGIFGKIDGRKYLSEGVK